MNVHNIRSFVRPAVRLIDLSVTALVDCPSNPDDHIRFNAEFVLKLKRFFYFYLLIYNLKHFCCRDIKGLSLVHMTVCWMNEWMCIESSFRDVMPLNNIRQIGLRVHDRLK